MEKEPCNTPGCGVSGTAWPWPMKINPDCMCGKPIWIALQPGQHIHPCPVHPGYTIWGPSVWW